MFGSKRIAQILTLLLTFGSGLAAQTSRPAEPELPADPRPISLELYLIDRTGMVEAAPQHGEGAMPSEAEFLLRGAIVELTSFTPDADEVVDRVETDENGVARFELDSRIPGSPYTLVATMPDGRRYLSKQQSMASVSASVHMFRGTDNHGALEQAVMKIVTVLPDQPADSDKVRVKVRQIVQYQNGGIEAFEGPPDSPGIGFVFSVPEGVQVTELTIGGEAALDLEVRKMGHWGWGVPIEKAIFPLETAYLIGVYELEVEEGEVFDAGFHAIVDTRGMQLSVETGEFTHDETVAKKWNVAALQPSGQRQMDDVQKNVTMFRTASAIPAHTDFKVPVRFGPPPIAAKTIWMTLLIIAAFALPVVAGVHFARKSAGRSTQDREKELQALHASGELSDSDYQEALMRLRSLPSAGSAVLAQRQALPDDVIKRLEAIAGRAEDSPESVADDVRAIASILKEHFSGDRR